MNIIKFKLWLESVEVINGIKFLINPSKQQLYNFIKMLRGKQASHDFDARGLIYGKNIYWWSAWDLTHAEAAQVLSIPYDYNNRLNGYLNNYGEVVIDLGTGMENHPEIKHLNLDYDGTMLI